MPKSRFIFVFTAFVFGILFIFLYKNRTIIYELWAPSPDIGTKAPDFALLDKHNRVIKLSDYKGKTVFLHFLASWCSDCRKELPKLQAFIYHNKSDPNVIFLNVSFQDELVDLNKLLKEKGYQIPVYNDPDGDVAHSYGVRGVPTTIVIDRQGKVIRKVIGIGKWNERLSLKDY